MDGKKSCVYKKVSGSFFFVVSLVLHVDDILIVGNCVPMLESVKACLSIYFSMKNLGKT